MDNLQSPQSPWLKIYSRPTKYPKLWSKGIIQKLLIKWAGCKCEHCGASQADALLHVHHLIWIAKEDCRWENLTVLCTSCHVKIHNQKWQPGKPWLERWGEVPQWAIVRGHLTKQGEPVEQQSLIN